MKAMASGMAAAALLGAGAAQAQERSRPTQAELFCHDLKRLVRNAPDFAAMYDARPAPPWFGFRPGACRASPAAGTSPASYWCHQHLAPAHLTLKSLVDMTAACLPDAMRLPERGWRRVSFQTPSLRIHVSESGGTGAKVGRIVGYRVDWVQQD